MNQSTKSAVIFDMDGVLIDSVLLHWQAYNEILGSLYGVHVEDAELPDLVGRSLVEQIPLINARHSVAVDPASFIPAATARVKQLLADVAPKPGVVTLLQALSQAGYALGVGTSTVHDLAEQRLTRLGIRQYFTVVTGGDEVSARKPDPEIYLKVAQSLGVSPDNCLVIEDAPSGIRAAHSAGMRVLAVQTSYVPAERLAQAELTTLSLSDVTMSTIKHIMSS